MALTTYGRLHFGDHITGKTTQAKPTLYAGLYASDPTSAGSHASELTFTGYARVEVTSKLSAVDTSGYATNTVDFNFGTPATSDNSPAFIGYSDAASGGNMIIVEQIPNPRAIVAGSFPVKIRAGRAKIRFI